MKGKQGFVIFVIMLVVLVPIHSSRALAEINSVNAHGSSEVEGMVRSHDSVTVEAMFDSIPDEAKIDFYGLREFDECEDAVCTYTSENMEISEEEEMEIIEYSEGNIVDSKSVQLNVDDEPPEIKDLKIEREGSIYKFDAKMKDYPSTCSGIGSLNVLVGEDIKETFEVDSSVCSLEKDFELSAEELSLHRGDNEICLEVYDRVGIPSERKCKTIFFDDREPELKDFRLLDMEGNEIEYVSEHKSIEAKVKVNVTDLQLNEVKGNFSDFNKNVNYYDVEAECQENGEDYVCFWDDLMIRSGEGELDYEVSAEDEQGNSALVDSSFVLTYDDSPPTVERIYTLPQVGDDDDKLYVSSGKNRIYIDFSDEASGFINQQVYADIVAGGKHFGNNEVENCKKKDNKWRCYWEIDISQDAEGDGELTLDTSSRDDAGNYLEEEIEKEIKIDTQEPVVKEANPPEDICPYAGSGMDIELVVESESPVKVNTTASEITRPPEPENFEADCELEEENEYKCDLHIDELVRTHTEASVNLNVMDAAGNKKMEGVDVEVCEAIEGEAPDLVDVDYFTTTKVDRRTLSYLDLPVPVNLRLEPLSQSEIVDLGVTCESPVEEAHITNKESLQPVLITRVGEEAAEGSEEPLNLNCTLELMLQKGGEFYTEPQREELEINLDATPGFGEMGASVEEKIDELDEKIEDIEDRIDSWEDWNNWLSKICSLAETLASMNSVMALIRSTFYGISAAMTSVCDPVTSNMNPVTAAICKSGWVIWKGSCEVTSRYHNYITRWVWDPSWLSGYTSGTGQWIKWLCFIYSCKLCTWDYADSVADITGIDSQIVRATGSFASTYHSLGGLTDSTFLRAAGGTVSGATSAWADDRHETSRIGLILDGNTMDPYKSIHAARACLCIPGIIYNLKKDKQIKCMYRNCLQERAEAGLPTDYCDKVHRERQCLYVEGAQWKALGTHEVFDFFQNLVGLIVRNLPAVVAAEAWSGACREYVYGVGAECIYAYSIPLTYQNFELRAVGCHVAGAGLQLMQVGSFMDVDFDKYDAGLEGDTVC